jgi:hypothetical protein
MPAVRIPVVESAFASYLKATSFTVLDCANCGVVFAVTDEFNTRRQWDGDTFYCPNGHANIFRGGEQSLKDQIATLEKRVTRLNAEVDQERAHAAAAVKSANATRGEMTKLRKRIANGVCPACHRTFSQLARHMKSKHPNEASA